MVVRKQMFSWSKKLSYNHITESYHQKSGDLTTWPPFENPIPKMLQRFWWQAKNGGNWRELEAGCKHIREHTYLDGQTVKYREICLVLFWRSQTLLQKRAEIGNTRANRMVHLCVKTVAEHCEHCEHQLVSPMVFDLPKLAIMVGAFGFVHECGLVVTLQRLKYKQVLPLHRYFS